MFLLFFFKCLMATSTMYDVQGAENVFKDNKINHYKDKLKNIFLDQVTSIDDKKSESIIFCTSVPKNKSLEVINAMKKHLDMKKTENEIFYYREISKICDNVYQGFDRTVEFIDEFLDFSLFYKKYPSNVKINEFNKHSFSFAIKFSDSENVNECNINDSNCDKKIDKDDEKNIPDLYMITDMSESYENYMIIRERIQEDINRFYSSPELIFANSFPTYRKTDIVKLDTIIELFFNYSFIMKDNKMCQFFFNEKYDNICDYFKKLLESTIKEFKNLKKDIGISYKSVPFLVEKEKEIKYLKIIAHFFKNISKEEWNEAMNSIKNYINVNDQVHIFCLLNNKNAKIITDNLKTIYTEISGTFDDKNQLFFNLYTFKKYNIHNKDKKNNENSYLKLAYKYRNLQNNILGMDFSMVFIQSESSFSRLFFCSDCINKFIDVYNNMDNPISNENNKMIVNDWVIMFKNLDLDNFNEVEIYVIKPHLQKFVDINIYQWIDFHFKNAIEIDHFLMIYRKQLIRKTTQSDIGFVNYNKQFYIEFSRRISFSKRDGFYKSFVTNFLEFAKKNSITIEKSFITDNSMCFRPFNIHKINFEAYAFKEHEHLYNQRKNIIESPNNNKNLTYGSAWIRSQIEFLFLLKSKKGNILKIICNVQLQLTCKEFILNNILLNKIKRELLILFGKESYNNKINQCLLININKNSILALTAGEADRICRIIYSANLTVNRFIEALDILLSKILFEAYSMLDSCFPNEVINHDINYVREYIEDIKDQILFKINISNVEDLIIDDALKKAKINFFIDKRYLFNDYFKDIILKKLYGHSWVLNEE